MTKKFPIIVLILLLTAGKSFSKVNVSVNLGQGKTPVKIIIYEGFPQEERERFRLFHKQARREKGISLLKNFFEQSQKPVLDILRQEENLGNADSVLPLWINNVILARMNNEAIQHLARGEKSLPELIILPIVRKPALLRKELSFPDELAWGVEKIGADSVWVRYGYTGRAVLVAILDTGLEISHPDITDRLFINELETPYNGIDDDGNGFVDDYIGVNLISGGLPYDDHGHGTHCTGTIAGNGRNGTGTGVAPEATVLPVKILDRTGNGDESDCWLGIQYAVEMGADIASLSVGWDHDEDPDRAAFREACDNAIACGMVLCIAAGNEDESAGAPDNLRTPGDVPSVITVGATDSDDELAPFSSVGPVCWEDVEPYLDYPYPPGLVKPDVVAPGVNITSTVLGGGYEDGWDGTSMAAPHTAGTAALLLSGRHTLSPEDIKSIIESTAVDLGEPGKDNRYGSGRIDAVQAIERMLGATGEFCFSFPHNGRIYLLESSQTIETSSDEPLHCITSPGGVDYTIVATAVGFSPETLLVHLPIDTTLEIEPSPVPLPIADVRIRLFDKLSGELIPCFELSSGIDSVVDGIGFTRLPVGESRLTFEACGYMPEETRISVHSDTALNILLLPAMNFEESDGEFSSTGDWEWGIPSGDSPPAHSGGRCWATNLDGLYSNSTESILSTADISLHSDSAWFGFYHFYQFEATSWGFWDGGNVRLSVDGGESEIIYPTNLFYDGIIDPYDTILAYEPAFSGEQTGNFWHFVRFDIGEYSGHTVRILFRTGEDDNTTRLGWYLDDFALVDTFRFTPLIIHLPHPDVEAGEEIIISTLVLPRDTPITGVCLFWRTGAGDFSPVEMVLSPGDSFSVTLPDTLSPEGDVEYYILALDSDPDTAVTDTFSFHIGEDTTPPVIRAQFVSPTLRLTPPYTVLASITDNLGVDTETVHLYARRTGTPWESFPPASVEDSIFSFEIPLALSAGDSIIFYIEACDASSHHNCSREPVDGYLAIVATDAITFDLESISSLFALDSIWQWGEPGTEPFSAHSGTHLLGTILGGYYPNERFARMSLQLDLSGCETAFLSFYQIYYFEEPSPYAPDGGNIKLITDGEEHIIVPESLYTGVISYSNPFIPGELCFGGENPLWEQQIIDLSDWAGENLVVALDFASDSENNDWGWYIDDITISTYNIKIDEGTIPDALSIGNPFPNPFNSSLSLEIFSPEKSLIWFELFNIRGERVAKAEKYIEGKETISFNLANFASGVYIYKIKVGGITKSGKAVLLK